MVQRLLPYSPERDIYRLLQVDPTAGSDEIVAACRRLARTFHPDRNWSPRATEEMQVVNAVRELLTDPASRAAYDGSRRRFLASMTTIATGVPRTPVRAPTLADLARPRLGRTLRAVGAGVRTTIGALAPDRCPGCRAAVGSEDRYCGWCGTPVVALQLHPVRMGRR
jgi:curved DNA-binding protein CbpA